MVVLAIKTWVDVTCRAPELPDGGCPFPRLVISPFTKTEHDRPSCRPQGSTHRCVSFLCVDPFRIAPVVFEVVNADPCIKAGILKFITACSGITCAGLRACAIIEAEFQSFCMYIIGDHFH